MKHNHSSICCALFTFYFSINNELISAEIPKFLKEGQFYEVSINNHTISKRDKQTVLVSAIDASGWVWMTELTVYRRYTEKGKDPIHTFEFSRRLESMKDDKEKKQFALLFDIEQTFLSPDAPYINGWVNVAHIAQIRRINLNLYVISEAENFGSIPHYFKDRIDWARRDQKELMLNDSRLPWKE